MLFRDVIELVTTTTTQNDLGDNITPKPTKQVFANKKSIRQSEFYQAMATGIKPEIMFEIRSIEYSGEKLLTYKNNEYRIIRTYDKNGELTELVCQGTVNNVSS